MKIEIPDDSILMMRKRRAELLQDLFEDNKLLLPETTSQMVMEVRSLSRTLSFIDKKKIEK